MFQVWYTGGRGEASQGYVPEYRGGKGEIRGAS